MRETHLKPAYNTWRGMKNRCSNKKYIDAHRYIERGITVCQEWHKYESFRDWALSNGYKEGLTIDRIDNNKGYYPENCRFVDQRTNCNNREVTCRIEYRGEIGSLQLLLSNKGKLDHYGAIYKRIKRGWTGDDAIDTPIKQGAYANRWA